MIRQVPIIKFIIVMRFNKDSKSKINIDDWKNQISLNNLFRLLFSVNFSTRSRVLPSAAKYKVVMNTS